MAMQGNRRRPRTRSTCRRSPSPGGASCAHCTSWSALYVTSIVGERYLAESYAERLPKASIGKSCVRFKRLSDVDTAVLAELLTEAAARPPGELAQGPNMP
ncbi:hypothetical protein [Amycolatopsis sp. NPDC058986]|uniref:hypothetical protein n=1 Tax=unclassified Amycolatopsis TaxID=2618356 RepID=UPI00366BC36A